jgi:hypothetical protein
MDHVQLPHGRSFCHRNRIKTHNGTMWLSVPIRRTKTAPRISEVLIDNGQKWQKKHCQSLYHAYSKAPYFKEVFPLLEEALCQRWEYLADLNIHLIRLVCDYMGLGRTCRFLRMRDMGVAGKRTDLLIDICKKSGGDTYVSGMTGKAYLDQARIEDAGLNLEYCVFQQPPYPQLWSPDFVSNLSTLDLLFNCGPESKGRLLEVANVVG